MSFFTPTEEEINKSSGMITFNDNEEVHLMIKQVDEADKNGNKMLVIKCDVLNGANAGSEYKIFIRDNQAGWSTWMGILRTFMTDAQIKAGFSASAPVGRRIKTVAKIKPYNGKNYVNFYDFWPLDGAPSSLPGVQAAPVTAAAQTLNDIPF